MSRMIFIVGCQRTGTTLMRLILDSHPDIHCFDEWKSYKNLETGNYSSNKPICGFKIPIWTELILNSHKKYYNNGPIIFMFRDVRATIASMLKLPTGEGTWFRGILKAIDEQWPNDPNRQDFFNLYGEELKRIEELSYKDYRKVALYWKYKTSRYLEMIKLGWPVLPVHYEFLTKSPYSNLSIICKFLQIEWNDCLLQHHISEHDEIYNGYAVGNTLVKRPIDTESRIKWNKILTLEEEKAILETAGEWNDYISLFANI